MSMELVTENMPLFILELAFSIGLSIMLYKSRSSMLQTRVTYGLKALVKGLSGKTKLSPRGSCARTRAEAKLQEHDKGEIGRGPAQSRAHLAFVFSL
jgi:hypothetical protein